MTVVLRIIGLTLVFVAWFAFALTAQEVPRALGGVVLPPMSYLSLLGQTYAVLVVSDGPYGVTLEHGIPRVREVSASTQCPVPGSAGHIKIAGKLTRHEQALALLQEVVHVSQQCAHSDEVNEEKVAVAVSDLMDSSIGNFVLEALHR